MTWRISSLASSNLRLLVAAPALIMTFHAAEMQRLDVILRLGETSSTQLAAMTCMSRSSVFIRTIEYMRHFKMLQRPLRIRLDARHCNAGINCLFLLVAGLRSRIKASAWILALVGFIYPFYLVHQNAGYILMNRSHR